MKNICFFNTIKFWGGGEKLHLENAIEFQSKGYRVQILAGKGSPLLKKAQENKLTTFPFTVGNLSFLNPKKIYQLVAYFKIHKIDTVFFSASQDLKIGAIAAKIAGVKRMVYLRGLAKIIKGNALNKYIFSKLLTHIIANSEETKRNILKNMVNVIPEQKVHLIYHGIAPLDNLIKPLDEYQYNDKQLNVTIIGNAGRLTSQKGQKHLIELAIILKARNLKFQIQIAGIGELQSELAQMIEENKLSKEVLLLGFVEDIDDFMAGLDIFALTSLYEGFGFVLVEAMMHSLPVVGFNLSSSPEIIEDNITGYLVEYPEMDVFADRIQLLLEDVDLRFQLGSRGHLRALKYFRFKDRHDELENYLLEVQLKVGELSMKPIVL